MSKQEIKRKEEGKMKRNIKVENRIDVLKQGTMSIRANCLSKDGCGY